MVVYDRYIMNIAEDGRAQRTRDEAIAEITEVAGDSVTSALTTHHGIQTGRSLRGVFTYESENPDGGFRLSGDFGGFHRLWPLAVGRTAQLSLDRQTAQRDRATQSMGEYKPAGRVRNDWRVDGEAPVKIGIVEFRTLRLIRNAVFEQADGSTSEVHNLRIYFAPELGWFLRFEATFEFPATGRINVVLWEAREIRSR